MRRGCGMDGAPRRVCGKVVGFWCMFGCCFLVVVVDCYLDVCLVRLGWVQCIVLG